MKLNHFNFKRFGGQILLTNDFGAYEFVTPEEFRCLVGGAVGPESSLGKRLCAKGMAYDGTSLSFSEDSEQWLRISKRHVFGATSLHIFVVTTACNAACVYCQAGGRCGESKSFMDKKTAENAVDMALQSPAHSLTFEFQGGEPLLNFKAVRHIVEYAEARKGNHDISYNIVTNLTLLTEEELSFFEEHSFGISTSLDGPAFIHDRNRPFKTGEGTFGAVCSAVERIRSRGMRVGAIQTTTRTALRHPDELISAYRLLGFDSLFIRPLTPLGKAAADWDEIGYTPEEFLGFYRAVLDGLLDGGDSDGFIREDHMSILINRVMGGAVNYMELRSPCGAGVGQLAYHPDGSVFTCDEGRMLYEMGDSAFRLGHVDEHSFADVVGARECRAVCASAVLESIPGCCDCVYQPYCGVCPVVSYSACGDLLDKEPRGYRCRIYSGMLDWLFGKLQNGNEKEIAVLRAWGE